MCVNVCLLQVNAVEELCGFALLKLCCDEGVKLFVVVPLTNFGNGGINEMFLKQFLKGACVMEGINGKLWKAKYTSS